MPTTSLKLSDELKARAAQIAKAQGQSTHAWLVQSVRRATEAAERRAEFIASASSARADALATGTGYAAKDVQAYIQDKVNGKQAPRPKASPWRE